MSQILSPEYAQRSSTYHDVFRGVRAVLEGENASSQLGSLASAVLGDLATLESSGHVQAMQAYLRELALVR